MLVPGLFIFFIIISSSDWSNNAVLRFGNAKWLLTCTNYFVPIQGKLLY